VEYSIGEPLKSPVKILPSIAFRSSLVMINHVPLQRPTRGFMLRISITGAPTFKCNSNDPDSRQFHGPQELASRFLCRIPSLGESPVDRIVLPLLPGQMGRGA
jgi:hypothetical protein